MTYIPLHNAIVGALCLSVWTFWVGVIVGLWKGRLDA
jgi:hypothetical protein